MKFIKTKKYELSDFEVGTLVIILPQALSSSTGSNRPLKITPLRVIKILRGVEDGYVLRVEYPEDPESYTNLFKVEDVEKIITQEQNPEYWL